MSVASKVTRSVTEEEADVTTIATRSSEAAGLESVGRPFANITLTSGAITLIAVRWGAWVIAASYVLWGPPLPVYTDREPILLLLALAQTTAVTGYASFGRQWLSNSRLVSAEESRDLLILGVADFALAMGLVYLSGGWGTPFYHFAVTALVVPAFLVGPRGSFLLLLAFGLAYVGALATAGPGTDGDWTGVARTHLFGHMVTAAMVIGAVQLLSNLTRQLTKERDEKEALAAEQERSRIAREIHDGVAQSIYMLTLNLSKATEMSRGGLHDRLSDLTLLARQCLLEVRQYIFDLRPLLSGKADLVEALRNQVREFETISGLEVEFEINGNPRELPFALASSAYRVVQEALANAYRHAAASRLSVKVEFSDADILLAIDDDGVGISPDKPRGRGINNMAERLRAQGGELEIIGREGGGTRVAASLPYGP
jgi:signal transduction histidine kinase